MSNSYLRENLQENYRNPQNLGRPASYDREQFLANRTCGDEITAYVSSINNKVTQISYEVTGCALCIASASILSQELESKSLSEIASWNEKSVQELLGTELTINRVKCVLLPLRAIQQALNVIPQNPHF